MPDINQKIIADLKKIRLFDGMDNVQLDRVAAITRPVQLKEGDTLRPDGKICPFFMIVSGEVRLTNLTKGSDGRSFTLKQGDFFGADVVFHGKSKYYNLVARNPALLFSIQVEPLRSLLNNIPGLTKNIKKQLAWYSLIRSKLFSFLGEEETVKLICRKHPAYLFVAELLPLVIAWLGALVIYYATQITTSSFRLAVGWFGAGMVGVAILWAIWRFFDWGNDFYIITDERIVWLERTFGLYDSRQEAPLVAIKAGETKSSQLGRWFGYGDVITQTFMGQIFFQHIRNPGEIKNRIDLERKLAMERQVTTDIHIIEGTIRQKIEPLQAATVPSVVNVPTKITLAPIDQETKTITEPLSYWQSFLALFKTRLV
jgi:hypothetical protein